MNYLLKLMLVPLTIAILSFLIDYLNHEPCQCPPTEISKSLSCGSEESVDHINSEDQFESIEYDDELLVDVKPKYWFHHPNNDYYIFDVIDTVLYRLGLEKITMDLTDMHDDWDLVWSYHFHDLQYLPFNWSEIKFYQKINHIPGNFVITSKSVFGTVTNSKYVPKAFTDVQMLQKYAEQHPDKRFVMKLKSNRGVQLKKVSEMNFTENNNLVDYFAQEFIENPLLFNGHKFDFAIYVAITSFQPLRFYYYTKNMIFRFCPKTYDLSDPTDYDRYVVSDSKIPVWEFEGTKRYFEHGYNTKDAFEGYLKNIGADVKEVWTKIEDCIREILMIHEKSFIHWTNVFKSSRFNHFELIRFDMILDTNLDLHVIEINQHPNLYPGAQFVRNKDLYENLLYNLFNLIGVGTTFVKDSLHLPSLQVENMIAHRHSLNVNPETCLSEICQNNCNDSCMFCDKCVSENHRYDQLLAYREQMSLGDFKRLFPPEQSDYDRIESELWDLVSVESRIHAKWFGDMCARNRNFC